MRDIREQLTQWLGEIRAQKDELDRLISAVQTALDAQQEHFEASFPLFQASPQQAADSDQIADFLQTALDDGRQRSVDELVHSARHAGIEFGDKNPNRVVNIMLVNLQHRKKVENVGERLWRKKPKPTVDLTEHYKTPPAV